MKLVNAESSSAFQSYQNIRADYKASANKIVWHPLLRGSLGRIWLATTGGALAGGFFDFFKEFFAD